MAAWTGQSISEEDLEYSETGIITSIDCKVEHVDE